MVPRVGIEPTLLSEPDFESGASTNFTTEAREQHYTLPRNMRSATELLQILRVLTLPKRMLRVPLLSLRGNAP